MIEPLNEQFALDGRVAFASGQGGLACAVIESEYATATVYLHGGHVTSFRPRGRGEVLWLSEQAIFRTGAAIRGGIPVCWPWFGPHPSDGDKPQHGFARNSLWDVVATEAPAAAGTSVRLRLPVTDATRALWPHEFHTELVVTVGRELTVALVCRNPGGERLVCGGALHTYLAVDEIARTSVLGLEGCEYIDQLDGHARKRQGGAVEFEGNVDRIYVDPAGECVVDDGAAGRRTRLRSSGSASTVVWNPWREKAAAMADYPADGYRRMVCVEAANAAVDVRTIAPGESHTLSQTISVDGE